MKNQFSDWILFGLYPMEIPQGSFTCKKKYLCSLLQVLITITWVKVINRWYKKLGLTFHLHIILKCIRKSFGQARWGLQIMNRCKQLRHVRLCWNYKSLGTAGFQQVVQVTRVAQVVPDIDHKEVRLLPKFQTILKS